MFSKTLIAAALLVVLIGCEEYRICTPPSAADVESFPLYLSDTGFDSSRVQPYWPQFELWTDGAKKQRWIYIPEGQKIDTSNMDVWKFPVGTKIWKQFSFDGRKIETRVLEKTGDALSDWKGISYIWDEDESQARKTEYGGVNVNGASHNVPAAGECFACHGGRPNRILGFSAVQLSYDSSAGLDLTSLVEQDLVSHAPSSEINVPGNSTEKAALGYLHANCSHCHNNDRPNLDKERCFNPNKSFSFLLTVGATTVGSTETYTTAIGDVITSGNPNRSRVIDLMENREVGEGMPPIGTKNIDQNGIDLITEWISELN